MTISLDKQYRTRDGAVVRLYCVDARGDYPVHGAILFSRGWEIRSWALDGKRPSIVDYEHPDDLIEVKPRIKGECWLNIYSGGHCCGYVYSCKEHADRAASVHRSACIKIEYDVEHGEGLNSKEA